jgi:transaldolase
MPEATLDAVRDHGETAGDTIVPEYAAAHAALDALTAAGIDLDDVVRVLEDEGVDKFVVAWEQLLAALKSALDASRTTAGR